METLGEKSIVDIYNKSGRNDSELTRIQDTIIQSAEVIPGLEINKQEMKIQINMKLLNKTTKVNNLCQELIELENELANVVMDAYIKNLILEELTATNNIEGINTTRDSVRKLLNGEKNNNFQEKNLVKHYLQILKQEELVLTPAAIREYYNSFLSDYISDDDMSDLGILFRQEGVEVTTETGKVIHTGIDGESNIELSLQNLINVVKSDEIEYFVSIAIFHYYFGCIHPFYDGNGRLNRLLTSIMLFPKINIASLALSKEMEKKRKLYYKMFDDTNNRMSVGDVTFFVYNFINLLESALEDTIDNLNIINKKINHALKFIDSMEIDIKYGKQIIGLIYQGKLSYSQIDITKIMSYLGITRNTARKYLEQLESENYIYSEEKSKKFIYKINEDLLKEIDEYVSENYQE